jgi:hypothetical protein
MGARVVGKRPNRVVVRGVMKNRVLAGRPLTVDQAMGV